MPPPRANSLTATTTSSRRTRRAPPGGSTRSPRRARLLRQRAVVPDRLGERGRFRFELDWTDPRHYVTVSGNRRPDAEKQYRPFSRRQGALPPTARIKTADGARFLRHRRLHYRLTPTSLRLGFLMHLDHLVGRRFGSGGPITGPSSRWCLHDDIDGSANIQFTAADDAAALLDGGLRRPQLRKGRRGRTSAAFRAWPTRPTNGWRWAWTDSRLDAVKHIYHNAYNDEDPTFLEEVLRPHERLTTPGACGRLHMVGEMIST